MTLPSLLGGKARPCTGGSPGRGGAGSEQCREDPQRQRFSILKTTHLRGFNNKHKRKGKEKQEKLGVRPRGTGATTPKGATC